MPRGKRLPFSRDWLRVRFSGYDRFEREDVIDQGPVWVREALALVDRADALSAKVSAYSAVYADSTLDSAALAVIRKRMMALRKERRSLLESIDAVATAPRMSAFARWLKVNSPRGMHGRSADE